MSPQAINGNRGRATSNFHILIASSLEKDKTAFPITAGGKSSVVGLSLKSVAH
jgi:hypothetical protein